MFRADKFVEVGHVFFLQAVTHFAFFFSFGFYFSVYSQLTKFTQTLDLFYGQLCWQYVRVLYSIINCDTKKKEKKGHITFWNMPALAKKGLTFS